MTIMPQTAAPPGSLPAAPTAIFAILGLIDIGLFGVVGSSITPPLAVSIFIAVLGLVTLVALVPARHGSRLAFITAVTALGAFFAGAPAWIMAVEGLVIVATIIAVVLLRRRPRPQGRARKTRRIQRD
jgi:uncharacterized membrane protein (DUF4010 family)